MTKTFINTLNVNLTYTRRHYIFNNDMYNEILRNTMWRKQRCEFRLSYVFHVLFPSNCLNFPQLSPLQFLLIIEK